MSLQKNLLTNTFEALLNAATQTPTDEVMNRDGINLMLQGFELIMQAHGFTYVDTLASVEEKPAVASGESDKAILVEIRDLLLNMAGGNSGIKIVYINHGKLSVDDPLTIHSKGYITDEKLEKYVNLLRARRVIREADMEA
ncbi:hypothetical protein GB989_04930 [Shigella sonnei]|nr:hypothetical protein [Shigella sonnei]